MCVCVAGCVWVGQVAVEGALGHMRDKRTFLFTPSDSGTLKLNAFVTAGMRLTAQTSQEARSVRRGGFDARAMA